ncbi:MAG TPA: GTPase Era [Steroidobacteraceae bacterium]|nr:GTPase Era [Steroidobacteraceae bacterium]
MSTFHSGFVALGGRPNVGKSTLLNALIGEKISIVTPRPQTTRHRVLGIVNRADAQIVFLDTPGLHSGQGRALNRSMNRTAAAALADAELILFVVEALRWTCEDQLALQRIAATGRPVIAVVNKVDRARPREKLLPFLAMLAQQHAFVELVPVSALRADNLVPLLDCVVRALPEGAALFPPEQVTDKGVRFRVAELIREKLTLELVEELPYGIAVEIEDLKENEAGQSEVSAIIWVEREGQKPIVIGAQGERLKRIGRQARVELNELFGQRFHLTLWVKVREGWADDARALQRLGME